MNWLPTPQRLERSRDAALLVCMLVATAANFIAHRHFYFEDAFITFRYADHLAQGLGMVFNPGERVLGVSSALYTLLLAAVTRLGLDVVDAGGLLYCACLSATGYLVARYLARQGYPNAGVAFALATAWGIGGTFRFFGMETALYILLIAASVIRAAEDDDNRRSPWVLGILLGLTCLTRYDGTVVAFVIGMYLWIRRRRPPWSEAFICSSLFGLWLLFAWRYFGSPLPNTLGAKAGDSSWLGYLASSWRDLTRAVFSPWLYRGSFSPSLGHLKPLLLGALIVPTLLWGRRLARRQASLLMWPAVAILLLLGYAVIGPPKEHHWYQMPSLYCLLAFVFAAWGEGWDRVVKSRSAWPTGLALGAILISLVAIPLTAPREGKRHIAAGPPGRIASYSQFAQWIVERDFSDTTLLTHEPGFLAFHTRQRAIDAAGLVSKDIYFHGPKERRSGLFQLIDRFDPDFLVLRQKRMWIDPRLGAGYREVSNGMPNVTLFMRRQLYAEQATALQDHWLQSPSAAHESKPLLDVVSPEEITTAKGWRLLGRPFDSGLKDSGLKDSGLETGIAWTAAWPVDFDEVTVDFKAESAGTRLQMLVDDAIVWELDHRGRPPGLQPATLSLYPWWGRRARLRLIDDDDQGGAAGLANLRQQRYASKQLLEDFEGAQRDDFWAPIDENRPSTNATPTTTPPPTAASIVQLNQELGLRFGFQRTQGRYVASTLGYSEPLRRFSRPFVLSEDRLQCMVYDLGGEGTSISLWVDGERVRHFKGTRSGQLRMLRWGVKAWRGRTAVLQLRDADSNPEQGLALDALLLYSP